MLWVSEVDLCVCICPVLFYGITNSASLWSLGGTTGYKEQESSGQDLLALVSPKKPDVEYFGRSARISGKLGIGGSFSLVFV